MCLCVNHRFLIHILWEKAMKDDLNGGRHNMNVQYAKKSFEYSEIEEGAIGDEGTRLKNEKCKMDDNLSIETSEQAMITTAILPVSYVLNWKFCCCKVYVAFLVYICYTKL